PARAVRPDDRRRGKERRRPVTRQFGLILATCALMVAYVAAQDTGPGKGDAVKPKEGALTKAQQEKLEQLTKEKEQKLQALQQQIDQADKIADEKERTQKRTELAKEKRQTEEQFEKQARELAPQQGVAGKGENPEEIIDRIKKNLGSASDDL